MNIQLIDAMPANDEVVCFAVVTVTGGLPSLVSVTNDSDVSATVIGGAALSAGTLEAVSVLATSVYLSS